jgi:ADP-ribose pyrophosphatase YjhB (NUDIX family)
MKTDSEVIVFDGRRVTLRWHEASELPTDLRVSQVSGFCVDGTGNVLVVRNARGWGLPGGHPESGELPEETLHREVAEEACAMVKDLYLIGYLEVDDPVNRGVEGTSYAQLRYVAAIDELRPFAARHETSERMLTSLDQVGHHIAWIATPTGRLQLASVRRFLRRRQATR